MSLESDMGRVTHDVLGAVTDAISINLTVVLKNDMNLSDDQVRKIIAVTKSTVESVGFNGINQYVNVAQQHIKESSVTPKGKLFG